MISTFIYPLFGWLPPVLQIVCFGVVSIFFLVTALRLVAFILDLIPFL